MPLDGSETALCHLWGQYLQRLGVGKAACQGLGDQPGVHPGTLGQRDDLGDDQGVARHDHLVAGLGHLACANAPHVCHPLAEHLQHWASTRQVSHLPAHHDRQGTCLRTCRAAGHRGIQPPHPTQGAQLGCHFPGSARLQAGKIHQQLALPPACGNALIAKYHVAHHGGIGQAQQYHVYLLRKLGRARGQSRACVNQRLAFFRAAVPHPQPIAGRQQALAHRQAHQTDTSET